MQCQWYSVIDSPLTLLITVDASIILATAANLEKCNVYASAIHDLLPSFSYGVVFVLE